MKLFRLTNLIPMLCLVLKNPKSLNKGKPHSAIVDE